MEMILKIISLIFIAFYFVSCNNNSNEKVITEDNIISDSIANLNSINSCVFFQAIDEKCFSNDSIKGKYYRLLFLTPYDSVLIIVLNENFLYKKVLLSEVFNISNYYNVIENSNSLYQKQVIENSIEIGNKIEEKVKQLIFHDKKNDINEFGHNIEISIEFKEDSIKGTVHHINLNSENVPILREILEMTNSKTFLKYLDRY